MPNKEPNVFLSYVAHGLNENVYKKYDDEENLSKIKELRKQMFGDDAEKIEFVVTFSSRNIQRKRPSDIIMAYREFLLGLPKAEQEKCRLFLHTVQSDPNGTDLEAVLRDCAPEVKAVFSPGQLPDIAMAHIFNNTDVLINLSEAEGFGLSVLSAVLSECMVVANCTGGLQDMMGFKDEQGNYLHPDIHYNKEYGTNSLGKYKDHGEWAIPVFPSNRSLIGSPITPYIYSERCNNSDAAKAIRQIYDMPKEERARRGKLGRAFALDPQVGMTSSTMCSRLKEGIDEVLAKYVPKNKFGVYKV